MRRLIRNIATLSSKVAYYSYYTYLSERERMTTTRFTNVVHEKNFLGGNVMVMALYEKTNLRADTIELLKEAKRQNIYVIAVNTLKLSTENYCQDLIDVYIERDNFGRDFGSYQVGMKYFFNKKVSDTCERLLLINDSVFFSVKGLSQFISDLYNTKVDVLGATENREISHHLGSFCISIAGDIARNNKFKNYWYNYKLTNVRPAVIKRGEFALSVLLRKLVRNEKNFKALYDINLFEKKLTEDIDFFRSYHLYRREGGDIQWTEKYVYKYFQKDQILKSFYDAYMKEKYPSEKKADREVNYADVVDFLSSCDYDKLANGHLLKARLLGIYLDDFTRGSQIHNNCIALHHLGLPIIKLDLVYRGVCDLQGIVKLKLQLADEQQDEFMEILTNRLDGNRFLFGFNRKAFNYGIM